MDIQYKVDGFLNNAGFISHLSTFLIKWNDEFPGIEEFLLIVHEQSYGELSLQETDNNWMDLSKDGKALTITKTYHKWYNQNGKVDGIPSVNSIYIELENHLNIAVERYKNLTESE